MVPLAVTVSAVGFGALTLLLLLLLVFELSMSPSSVGGRASLVRPLVLAPAPAFFFAFEDRARMLWQFRSKQDSSLSSSVYASSRNRARFTSVCRVTQR